MDWKGRQQPQSGPEQIVSRRLPERRRNSLGKASNPATPWPALAVASWGSPAHRDHCPRHGSTTLSVGAGPLWRGHNPDCRTPSVTAWRGRPLASLVIDPRAGFPATKAARIDTLPPHGPLRGRGLGANAGTGVIAWRTLRSEHGMTAAPDVPLTPDRAVAPPIASWPVSLKSRIGTPATRAAPTQRTVYVKDGGRLIRFGAASVKTGRRAD
jgi:hypothetical protein